MRLSRAVADMAKRIKKQLSDQRELLATVSHEVRSPLARVRLLSELLRDESSAVRKAKLLDDLEQEIVEIDDLVGGLLAQSRLDFSALSIRSTDVLALVKRTIERAGAELVPNVSGKIVPVACDATLFARALSNLLENARKHAGGATAVTLRFSRDELVLHSAVFPMLEQLGELVPSLITQLLIPLECSILVALLFIEFKSALILALVHFSFVISIVANLFLVGLSLNIVTLMHLQLVPIIAIEYFAYMSYLYLFNTKQPIKLTSSASSRNVKTIQNGKYS